MRILNRLKPALLLLPAFVLGMAASPASAMEITPEIVAKVGACVACHGADGIGKAPQYPNLAGQKATYIEKQLSAFRSGERKDPNMSAMAKPLSDQDIVDIAAYFESLE
jgi:cytochrome c553